MTDNTQLIEDLQATKRTLQQKGRCTTAAYGPDGSVCLVIATRRAIDGQRESQTPWRDSYPTELLYFEYRVERTQNALSARMPDGYSCLVGFNEDPNTTDADVYNLIDKALAEVGGL
jgi:hypothetical protein